MKEIIYKHNPKGKITEIACQACGGRLYHTTIPCPDQKEGCLVLHYGYRCDTCGRIFQ